MNNKKFLGLVRAAIGAEEIPKKVLARRCKVSRPQFSEMIHGDREMPRHVMERLIRELDLENALGKYLLEIPSTNEAIENQR
jgi:hypothetical protein